MKHISYDSLQNWVQEGKRFMLFDVREIYEHETFNIGGNLIPLQDVIKRKEEFLIENLPVVIYCKRGIRSQIAIQRLAPHLPNVEFYNLENGIYQLLK